MNEAGQIALLFHKTAEKEEGSIGLLTDIPRWPGEQWQFFPFRCSVTYLENDHKC